MKVTALFDPSIDNNAGSTVKEDALVELIEDYNKAYGQEFTIPTWPAMKKDISARLSHKKPYVNVDSNRDSRIDLLIVVDQMLTGFDSKWLNTLYLDKVIDYESIIQAFSRTNRLFGPRQALRHDPLLPSSPHHEGLYRSGSEAVFGRPTARHVCPETTGEYRVDGRTPFRRYSWSSKRLA